MITVVVVAIAVGELFHVGPSLVILVVVGGGLVMTRRVEERSKKKKGSTETPVVRVYDLHESCS